MTTRSLPGGPLVEETGTFDASLPGSALLIETLVTDATDDLVGVEATLTPGTLTGAGDADPTSYQGTFATGTLTPVTVFPQAYLSWASLETSVAIPQDNAVGIDLGFSLGTLTALTSSSAQAFLAWAELETSVPSPAGPSPLVNGQSAALASGSLSATISKVLGGYDLALTPATITAFGGESDDPTAQSGEFAIGDLTGEASYTLLSQTLTGGLGTFTSRFGDPTFILGDLTPVVSLDLVGVSLGSETGAFQEQIDEGGISILLTGLTLGIAPGSVLISNVTRDLVGISMGFSIPSTISGTRWEDTPTPDSIWTDVPEEDTTWTPA